MRNFSRTRESGAFRNRNGTGITAKDKNLRRNDPETGLSLAVVSSDQNGVVTGDGVRLRSAPNTSGTILEKMYNGELVIIKKESNGCYKIQRIKTGTIGWASKSYINRV